ncbi:aspartate/glutamate racemase family protein [Niabella ginsengisoli]|uniref:Uncharacterized protein n=1 Tax=Niabella ginsengisoli TaxID=522298 RepID=A0ABS9SPR1_9BACT|nr:hypothetical protein [Niabella ginsengisoli]MCH5600388.1 hypothetical protein [Niabella ginsengisoli]
MRKQIQEYLPVQVKLLSQGEIVAKSLADYLLRHPKINEKCSKNNSLQFFTTDSIEDFDSHASLFFGASVQSEHVGL